MTRLSSTRLDRCLAGLAQRHAGPGGAVAVLRAGEVLVRHAWGWADVARRIPFTPATLSLVCSITKQFTCALLLDRFPDPTVLQADLQARLKRLAQPAPSVLELCHNQSGLRDYWATAMLCGAAVEGHFGQADSDALIGRTRTLQFAPGTRYSYANQNFRLLSEMIEARAGESFATLLRRHVLDRADMPHAVLNPDTSVVAGGTVGYEGSMEAGFRPAANNITWTGDAGLAASLDDMIAWEASIDAARDDAGAPYSRLSQPQFFNDGAPAYYGFGLAHATLLGRNATCHGGGLRGWRSFRCYIPTERVSVVALFNHMGDPRAAAMELLAALLDEPEAEVVDRQAGRCTLAGHYLEPETGLAVRVEPQGAGDLRLRYAPGPERLLPAGDGAYMGSNTRLYPAGEDLRMERRTDHLKAHLLPCDGEASMDVEGRFHNAELDATLTCVASGGAMYGAFSGALGQGAMQPMVPFGRDVWLLPCPRALDHAAPGDWTLAFRRNAGGRVTGLQLGCWLARGLDYEAC